MRLLLLSNSTMAGKPFLGWPRKYLKSFIGAKPMKILFIPYAGVNVYWDGYYKKVSHYFDELDCEPILYSVTTGFIKRIVIFNIILDLFIC